MNYIFHLIKKLFLLTQKIRLPKCINIFFLYYRNEITIMKNWRSLVEKINVLIQRNSHGFLGSILVLVSGTALGHAITSIALLLLTRLFTPEQFGLLAIYTSLLAIVSVNACLRFEIAIPIAQDDETLDDLIFLSLVSLVTVTLLISVLVIILPENWLQSISTEKELIHYLWLLPIGVFWTGLYGIIQNIAVKQKRFVEISRSRVLQSGFAASIQILNGIIKPSATGLIVGFLCNVITGAIFFICEIVSRRKQLFLRLKNASITYPTLKRYQQYPKYSTWESLANSTAIQAPIVIIGFLSTKSESGYLLLAMSIVQAPMSLFGSSIGQVYFSKAPEEFRANNLNKFTLMVFGNLIKTGVGPLIFIGMLAPVFFGIVFGDIWIRAGWLVLFMMPWFTMQFISTPISMAIHVTGHQKQMFLFQVFGLILRCGSVLIASKFLLDQISLIYAFSGFIFYALYLWLIFWCVNAKWQDIKNEIMDNVKYVSYWILSASSIVLINILFKVKI